MERMKFTLMFLVMITTSFMTAAAKQPQSSRSFEVASIRPGAPADAEMIPIRMKAERSRIHYVNVSLRDCIRVAYGVKEFQISGPDWIGTRFNIEATYPAGATEDQVPEMLQSLLQERFKLQIHREMKEHAVYALVVGKKGPKLRTTEFQTSDYPDSPTRHPGTPVFGDIQIMGSPSGMHLAGPAVTMRTLSETLSLFTNDPVIDQTGLQGRYDIDLVFIPDNRLRMRGGPGSSGRGLDAKTADSEPSGTVFDAVRDYGLKLESRKAPLMTIVVDHLEKIPSAN